MAETTRLNFMTRDEQYQEMLAKAQNDPGVIGFILGGGRGKGAFTENSDYDIIIIASDEAKDRAVEIYEKAYDATEIIEVRVRTLGEFKSLGAWGSDDSWQRYHFAHLKAQIDRTGEVQKLIDEKGRIPEDEQSRL
jgi:predicted nucleotidyltransferase